MAAHHKARSHRRPVQRRGQVRAQHLEASTWPWGPGPGASGRSRPHRHNHSDGETCQWPVPPLQRTGGQGHRALDGRPGSRPRPVRRRAHPVAASAAGDQRSCRRNRAFSTVTGARRLRTILPLPTNPESRRAPPLRRPSWPWSPHYWSTPSPRWSWVLPPTAKLDPQALAAQRRPVRLGGTVPCSGRPGAQRAGGVAEPRRRRPAVERGRSLLRPGHRQARSGAVPVGGRLPLPGVLSLRLRHRHDPDPGQDDAVPFEPVARRGHR